MCQCLKFLVVYVSKSHIGNQTIGNILLLLNKEKQEGKISGVVERSCSEFMSKRLFRIPLV